MVEFECANCHIQVIDIVGDKAPVDKLCLECRVLSRLPNSEELARIFDKPVPSSPAYVYMLIGQTPVPCSDVKEWARWMETADRVVFQTEVGPYFVSTVFLGMDHSFGLLYGKVTEPLLFETMIFSIEARKVKPTRTSDAEPVEKVMERYSRQLESATAGLDEELLEYCGRWPTWSEAETEHELAVRLVEVKTGIQRTEKQEQEEGQSGTTDTL